MPVTHVKHDGVETPRAVDPPPSGSAQSSGPSWTIGSVVGIACSHAQIGSLRIGQPGKPGLHRLPEHIFEDAPDVFHRVAGGRHPTQASCVTHPPIRPSPRALRFVVTPTPETIVRSPLPEDLRRLGCRGARTTTLQGLGDQKETHSAFRAHVLPVDGAVVIPTHRFEGVVHTEEERTILQLDHSGSAP